MTPEQAAILALLDTVQRLERRIAALDNVERLDRRIAALERDAAQERVLTDERKVKNGFTGRKVVNGRRGNA